MIACSFAYSSFTLFASVFQSFSCLEISFSVYNNFHAIVEYTLQDSFKCKPHVPRLTKQCDIRKYL